MMPVVAGEALFDALAQGMVLAARIGGFLVAAPLFDNRSLPAPVKVYLTMALALLLFPLIEVPVPRPLLPNGIALIGAQVVIGVALAFGLRIVFSAASLAGYLVGQQMGLGFAALQDPQNGAQTPLTGRLYVVALTLAFLALDGHLLMIGALVRSYQWLPASGADLAALGGGVIDWTGRIFSLATVVALPAVTALLMVNLSFGVLTRAAPQLNILVVGFPMTLLLGLLLLVLTLPGGVARLNEELLGAVQALPALRQ